MALTPIAYTQNWKDVYGSQNAPEANAAKITPPVATAFAIPASPGNRVNWTVSACSIDWGDGSSITVHAGGVAQHIYQNNGAFIAKAYIAAAPDVFIVQPVRITTVGEDGYKDFVLDKVGLSAYFVSQDGLAFPVVVDWGDGTPSDYVGSGFGFVPHDYAIAETYTVTVYDSETDIVVRSIAVAPVPLDEEPEPEAAWMLATRHAELDEFVKKENLDTPDDWATMTIADKKAWLGENF